MHLSKFNNFLISFFSFLLFHSYICIYRQDYAEQIVKVENLKNQDIGLCFFSEQPLDSSQVAALLKGQQLKHEEKFVIFSFVFDNFWPYNHKKLAKLGFAEVKIIVKVVSLGPLEAYDEVDIWESPVIPLHKLSTQKVVGIRRDEEGLFCPQDILEDSDLQNRDILYKRVCIVDSKM